MCFYGNTMLMTLPDMLREERYAELDMNELRELLHHMKDTADATEIKLEIQRRERMV